MMKRFILTVILTGLISGICSAADADNAAAYQAHLKNLFTDLSCSKLKPDLDISNLAENADFIALPEALRNMTMKIAGGDWSETTTYKNEKAEWDDSHARKYRVQMYEPYSEGGAAASMAGISQYTNMCNPTGILGDKGTTLYVMVRDDIQEGSTLYIREVADLGAHNDVKDGSESVNGVTIKGIKLNKGLNIITTQLDNSHLFIYYSVATAAIPPGGTRYQHVEKNSLSKFSPVKIHIEGGRINGFFNYVGDTAPDSDGTILYKGDTEEDFQYTVMRATHPMYDLIGHYLILHFNLEDTPNGSSAPIKGVKSALLTNRTPGDDRVYNPVRIMRAWDNMCLSERILMGLQSDDEIKDFNEMYAQRFLGDPNGTYYETIVNTGDEIKVGGTTYKLDPGYHYSDYFNNKLMGISENRDGLFMSATSWRMNFHVNTVENILTLFERGDIWGPAHEYGHINQGPMNMAGTTEVSNNIFSNVAVYFSGKYTSRSDFISSQFNIFQQGKNYLDHGTWGTTRMFWQLWCYYHATGHNKKFYPRLYELLRNYPLKKVTRPGKHNERYDQLQFAKMCCLAAGEDLTDFFTAWGFFEPFDYMYIGDYSTYDAYLTQEDIDAVKAEIADFKLPKNESIILIDDRPGITDRTSFEGFPIKDAGDFGGLEAFREERAPSGSFGFSVDINTVTITTDGDPGAGFIIKDQEGNLLGFSNSKTFTVNDELAEKLRTGEAIMEAVGANNATQEVVNLISNGSIEAKTEILMRMLAIASDLLNYVDPTETKVGYLLVEKTSTLKQLINDVDNAVKGGNLSSEAITDYINNLTEEFNRLTSDDEAFIQLDTGNLYMLTNAIRSTNGALSYSNNICAMVTKPAKPGEPSASKFQWNFIPGMDENTYYIQNWDNKAYLDKAANGTVGFQYSGGYKYNLIPFRNKNSNIGQFILAPFDDLNLALHIGGNGAVIGYTSEAGASKWYITKVVDADKVDMTDNYRQLLENLTKQYEEYKAEIDPNGVTLGYLKPEAAGVFDEKCSVIYDGLKDDNMDKNELADFYIKQLQIYKNLTQPNSELRIGVEPGAAYMLQNVFTDKDYSLRYLSGEGDYVSTNPVASDETFARQWVFEGTDDPELFALRNLEPSGEGKYVGNSLDGKQRLTLSVTPVYFKLNPVEDKIGEFGLSIDGDISHSLITRVLEAPNEINVVSRMASLSFMTGDEGKWRIKKVHDKEYVELREYLGNLLNEIRDIMSEHYSIPGMDINEWMELWYEIEDAVSTKGPTRNPETSYDDLREWVDKCEGTKVYLGARINEEKIITITSIGSLNDGIDNNTSSETDGLIRYAFNISDSMILEGKIGIDDIDDPSNIIVDIQPYGHGQWISSSSSNKDDLMNDYKKEFSKSAPESALFNQLQSLECNYIDGFYTGISGKLVENKTSYDYDLIISSPCSGLYKLTLKGKDGYSVLTSDKRVPSILIEVYPNLLGVFNKDKGFNIEGYTFSSEPNEGYPKKIFIPKEFVNSHESKYYVVYIPGIYFVDEFTVVNESDGFDSYSLAAPYSAFSTTSNPGASKYYATVDLSGLKTISKDDSKKLNVSVSKNGATSNFTFLVAVGENKNVSTNVESVETEDLEPVYYNLHGVRVNNPQHGIYIKRIGNKTEKVIL